jgi:hypothetical protein
MYAGTHSTEPDHISSFTGVDTLYESIKDKRLLSLYGLMVDWSCVLTICRLNTKAVRIEVANRREIPKETFSEKLERGRKLFIRRNSCQMV